MIDVALGFEREVDDLSVRDGINIFSNHRFKFYKS